MSKATQVVLCLVATALPLMAFGGQVSGELRKWHPLTIDFQGPTRNELDVSPNPFLDFRLQVTFTAPRGTVYTVPGYFDGNGTGGATGSVWRVRFTPDEAGQWSYQASFRTGAAIAVNLNPTAGTAAHFDGDAGTISVADRNPNAAGFLKYGRLESIDQHHLKFRDGGFWLKLGTNNPENLLGYEGFDNTPNAWHSYANHIADWQSGDPDWDSPDSAGTTDGRGIIGALNYLAEQEINSIYFMPMNIGADGQDVWPYASPAINRNGSTSNDNLHFDISKLRQWEQVFQHAQRKGLFLHFVLSDKTAANKQELDNATLGTERKLFYRELVARFGHHNALQWNICEEFNLELPLSASTIRAFGQHIQVLDPYDHPITVHPHGNTYATALAPFLGDSWFRVMSVQTWQEPESIGPAIEYFRQETAEANNAIPVMIDESIGMNQISANDYRKRTMWDAWLSGGGFEMFKSFGDSDLDDFRVYEEYFDYARNARRFVDDNLPFWEMVPADGLVSGENTLHGGAEVFAKAGEVYAIYLPNASPSPVVSLGVAETFERRWFNPRTGAFQGSTAVVDGSSPFNLGPPPAQSTEDWAVLISVVGLTNEPPVAQDQIVHVLPNTTADITLGFSDTDGPGPYTFTLLQGPSNGVLGSNDGDALVTYTPNAGYTGPDAFSFQVNDGLDTSNVATVSVSVGTQTTVLLETFNGADSTTVGSGWAELEGGGSQVGRQGNRLVFIANADAVNRPMVTRSFQRTTTGELIWDFEFDWTRTGAEGTYRVFMQLGDGALMNPNSQDAGIGVNLVWGPLNGQHQWLGYRAGGSTTGLAQISGLTDIRVIVNLAQATYDVLVDGVVVRTVVPLDNASALDTVRFFTDSVNESNFAGRAFDTVQLTAGGGGGPENEPPVAEDQSVNVPQNTAANITLGFSDTDGPGPHEFTLLQAPANGVLGSDDGDALVTYTPNAGYTGPDSFTFRVNDSLDDSNVATVSLSVTGQTALLSETFDGADSTTVGSGWAELEGGG
ncbi:MAG: Ig-like domain-containing protein, partial [Woeseia sp.]